MSSCMNKKRSIHIHFVCVCVCVRCSYVYEYGQRYEYIILTDGLKCMELFNLKT